MGLLERFRRSVALKVLVPQVLIVIVALVVVIIVSVVGINKMSEEKRNQYAVNAS